MNTFRYVVLVFLASGLLACVSAPTSSTQAFPTGRYGSNDVQITFTADGRTEGAARATGGVWGRGRFRIDGDAITLIDEWYADGLPMPSCKGMPGRYRWANTDGQLKFVVIEDACTFRARDMQGQVWARID